MCGIAGVLTAGRPVEPEDEGLVGRMLDVLRHRGPDDRGLKRVDGAVLGNARLNIMDPTRRGALPMTGGDGGVLLAYNGEITNYLELKERFKLGDRFDFKSGSDSEVLLRLYEAEGIGCLKQLSGYFAFCLVDLKKRKAWLVRDFFGVRPLFYTVIRGRLHFASEIKALLEIPGLDRELDREGLFHFFSLAYIPGERTPFRSIRELRGGRLVEVDLASGKHEEREYYSLRYEPDESLGSDPGAAADKLRETLREAVSRNLRADAPVGLALSGGVDSSSILVLAKEAGTRLHTFSIKMGDPTFDESPYQKIIVDHAKPVHHEVTVGPDEVLRNVVEHIAFMDEPTGDGAAVPLMLLARQAKEHVKVLLSGEGGDEVFNAYETHRAYRVRKLYRRWMPGPARRLIRAFARSLPVSHDKLSFDFLMKRFTEGAELGVPESHIYWRHALTDEGQRGMIRASDGIPSTGRLFREAYDRLDFADELDRLAFLDIMYYFIDDLMVKNDRMIMASSIESRFPYMERPVVEFSARLPTRLKVRGMTGRIVQRRAMEGLLPPDTARRPNMGLEMPYSRWFLGPFRELAEKHFARDRVASTEVLDPDAVRSLWEEHASLRRDNGRALWCLLNLLIWFDLYVRDGDYKKHLRKA